jgi:hypothetical protein
MIRHIAPLFFTMDLPATLTYYKDKLGFDCVGTWQHPPVYAIVARDQHRIHFRCAEPPVPNPDKYEDELLDAYLFIDDVRGVCEPRGRVHASACQHALGLARIRREGL